MDPEGTFNQLQLTKSRSRNGVWKADDDAASRRSSARESVMSEAERWSKSRRTSTDSSRTERNASTTSLTMRGQEVRYWDGLKKTTGPWDDLRRDPELWFEDGNLLVHFYGRGTSRKGPTLRLHRDDIEDWGFRSIINKFLSNTLMEEEEESSQEDDYDARFQRHTKRSDEVYIPSPPLLGRDDAVKFHITTRNLFAFLYEKPMVGPHLGEALVLMHERLNQYRPDKERNRDDMIAYIEDQGYTEFRDSPDHAMGIMYYAEKLRDTDLWTEAFVHCVGMYDILNTAIEFPTVSRTIGALITRAHLEMTLRLEHAYADLGTFLQDSMGSAFPKLSESAMKHMEKFRSWLHQFYVEQHGYWPPPTLQPGADYNMVTKSLLRSLYADFRNLYAFICDPKSEPKPTQAQIESYKAIYGGICTPHVIAAFDKRYKNTPLPNPLPLLPSGSSSGRVSPLTQASNLAAMDLNTGKQSGNAFTRFLRPKSKKSMKALNTLNLLSSATNSNDSAVLESVIVQEYSKFERDWTVRAEEKLDATEARKVRWLLIYAVLQTVIGVTVVPREVAATEHVEYPLCVQTGGTPPWKKRSRTKAVYEGASTPQLEALSTATSPAASPYLTPTTPGARSGADSGAMTPISGLGEIPPVPQLVLSELEKLQRRSFDSGRSTPVSLSRPGSSGGSIKSNKLQKKKSTIKSSSASIKSNRSTRSSFSMMMNRSLAISDSYGAYGASSVSVASEAPSQATAKASASERGPERPSLAKQKSAPAQIQHELSSARQHKQRTSLFGRMRSRTSSIAGDSEYEVPNQTSLASPISPVHSTFSQAVDSNTDDTPATTEFPQQTELGEQQKPSSSSSLSPETARFVQNQNTRGNTVPMLDTSFDADRGRALHAPHSPSLTPSSGKKVRNFSRGRSGERPKSSGHGHQSQAEAPPPVPNMTKPRSAASSPARSVVELSRTYTDSRAPPPVPAATAAYPTSPSPAPIEVRPMVNHATKPRSRPASPHRQEEYYTPAEELPMPPPIPFTSKPNSRNASPVRSPTYFASAAAASAAANAYGQPTSPLAQQPHIPLAQPTQPETVQYWQQQQQQPQQQQPQYYQQYQQQEQQQQQQQHHRHQQQQQQQQRQQQQQQQQQYHQPTVVQQSYQVQPSQPLQQQQQAPQVYQRPAPAVPAVPAVQQVQQVQSQTLDPGYQYHQQPEQQQRQHQQQQQQEEYRGRSVAVISDERSPSRSRSLALRPPPPPAQARPSVPSAQKERPVSNVSEDSEPRRGPRNGSVSPVSDDDAPYTNGNYSQATSQPGFLPPHQPQPGLFEEISHAVTTPDDSAHTAWNSQKNGYGFSNGNASRSTNESDGSNLQQQGSFQQVLAERQQREQERKRGGSGPQYGQQQSAPRQQRTSSRESRYRRAAWAELGSSRLNEANGMPIPPPAVRQYGAPIVRDAPRQGYGQANGGAGHGYSDDDTDDDGVSGGMASYGMKRGLMG